ncbi:phosphosulfolactate synthase [Mucilaginibacter pallidiroseus]|uniref:Phosphosulfolactate synthase n=1 Tax=Mucilaginibacter pallidiroseus TaxID=2599295 RepID=A0A563U0Q5_9SPHI|nr:phosphosulfolactate synthase [Mucilaginibacter pallidiroseus]TWR24039.1 phosphosulfolactate synthase [Mucilaginibacter pallidiroseus]
MNYHINDLPERVFKPRNSGITMVMDKGLSVRQAQDLVEVGHPYIDMIKLGWATSAVTPTLTEKLKVYKDGGIKVYFGGTLFEAMIVRNQFDDYCRILDQYQLDYAEVSDGSITIEHDVKCDYISRLSKQITVISEVGSKDVQKVFAPYKWINLMQAELDAGAWKVIAEARESGNVGIYRDSGEVRQGLVDEILTRIPEEKIIWEAPQKTQQVWFIKLIGANVSLGNIAPADIIPLETLRLGLRSDTFEHFLKQDQSI